MRLGRDAPFAFALGQRATRSGVDGAGRAVRRRQAGGDVGARAKTGIDEAARSQIVERGGIGAEPARLAYRVAVPIEAASSAEQSSELQSLLRISYAVFCLITKHTKLPTTTPHF